MPAFLCADRAIWLGAGKIYRISGGGETIGSFLKLQKTVMNSFSYVLYILNSCQYMTNSCFVLQFATLTQTHA